jgi:hypothetical protein
MRILIVSILFLGYFQLGSFSGFSQTGTVKIGLAKYSGGGDWYANPTSLPNLIRFCNQQLGSQIHPEPATIELGSSDIFNYPFVHLTGHGNIVLSARDMENLRNYLYSGGFLHVDDNYGMDEHIRREVKRLFPEKSLVELPFSHPIFHQKFDFPNGLPKTHEHDKKPPQAFGLFHEGRLIFLYTYESDLGDGWEDQIVHSDSEEARLQALRMGANLISFVFQQ